MGRRNRQELWGTCRKTELCQNFLHGCCAKENCRFARSPEEVQEKPDLTRTKMCRAVQDGKECVRKDCTFAHSEEELVPVSPQGPTLATRRAAPSSETITGASAPVQTRTSKEKPAVSKPKEPKASSVSTAKARPRRAAPVVVRSEKTQVTVVVSLSAELNAPQPHRLVLMEELGLSAPHSEPAPRSTEQCVAPETTGQWGQGRQLAPQPMSVRTESQGSGEPPLPGLLGRAKEYELEKCKPTAFIQGECGLLELPLPGLLVRTKEYDMDGKWKPTAFIQGECGLLELPLPGLMKTVTETRAPPALVLALGCSAEEWDAATCRTAVYLD